MNRATGLVLALVVGLTTACATAGSPSGDEAGERPRDNQHTRAAGVAMVQGTLREGDDARRFYQEASEAAHQAIESDPTNPRAYLLAGQAAIGIRDWVQADTMFDRAQALYPRYGDQIVAERLEGWVDAYNLGAEALSAGDLDLALELFRGADILYQESPQARMALAAVHLRRGETAESITAFERALEILSREPPSDLDEESVEEWYRDRRMATFNMAQLLAQTGRFGEAADVIGDYIDRYDLEPAFEREAATARAGFLAQAGRTDEADAAYASLLDRSDLGPEEFFQVGVGFFNTGDYERAAEAFASSARLNPHLRDAYLNLVQSLYSAALELEATPQSSSRDARLRTMYDELLAAAERVQEFDPLNRNLLSFTLRAYRGQADLAPAGAERQRLEARTQEVFREYQAQPYEVSDLTITPIRDNRGQVTGMFTNLSGTPGREVGLRFTVLDSGGNALDTSTARVVVPAREMAVEFSTTVTLSGDFAGWKYEVVD